MKKLIWTLALCIGLVISAEIATAISKRISKPARQISLQTVLQSHNVPRGGDPLSSTISEASRFTYFESGPDTGKQDFFERKTVVYTSHNAFKVSRTDPMGLRKQIDASDGIQENVHAEYTKDRAGQNPYQMQDAQLASSRFFVGTFGLAPILKQLSEPSTTEVWLGSDNGEDILSVTGPAGAWMIYVNNKGLIHRVEIGKCILEYGDYRVVNGINLPFFQKLYVGNKLVYELTFSRIELNHDFPQDFFSKEMVGREIAN
jgi:hypothetical protein